MLKSIFLLTLGAVLFSSCATILNSRREVVTIKKDSTIKNFTIENKGVFKLSEEKYEVLRSKNQPLVIKAVLNNNDSAKTAVYPRISLAFFGNFLPSLPFIIVGVLVDAGKDKKFGYPPKILLTNTSFGLKTNHFHLNKKGLLQANLGLTFFPLPNVSAFHKSSGGKALSFLNYLGLGAGLNYYYQNNQYIGLETEATIGTGIKDGNNSRSRSTIWFWNLKNNLVKNKWELGYGLSYARTEWSIREQHYMRNLVASEKSNLLGLNGSLTYRISDIFGAKFQFQPYFYSFGNQRSYSTFQYFAGVSLHFYFNAAKVK